MIKKAFMLVVIFAMATVLIFSEVHAVWAGCGLFGDLNNDGKVDITDIMLVANCWRSTAPDCASYDLDGDDDIDIVDIMLVAARWGDRCPMPASFGIHTFNLSTEAKTRASEAGVRWISGIWLAWSSVEPDDRDLTNNPMSGNWGLGGTIQSLQDAGFIPIVTIARAPSWAMPTRSTGCDFANAFMDDFEEFMWAAAERYDGDGDYNGNGSVDGPAEPEVLYWELFNEADYDPTNTVQPYDHGGCWGNRGADYGEMMRRAYLGVKRGNPAAKVVFSGIAYDRFTSATAPSGYPSYWYGPFNYNFVADVFNYLRTNYGSEEGYPFVDVVNVHVYDEFRPYWDGATKPYDQQMLGKVKKLKARLTGLGVPELPIMVTEAGIHSDPTDDWTIRSEELQAIYATQTLVRGEVLGLVANQWFTLVDFQHELGYKYGLLKNDAGLTEKLAYAAYLVATEQLTGWEYDQQVTWSDNRVEGHRFMMEDGAKKIVLWTDTGERLGKKGTTSVTTNITFNSSYFPGVTWTGRLRITNKYGGVTTEGSPGATSVTVTATQSPIFVEVAP